MALDQSTIGFLKLLTQRLGCSKAEVIRRAVRQFKEEEDRKQQIPGPLEALDWLQNGGGLTLQEASAFKEEIRAEREAKRYWWEA